MRVLVENYSSGSIFLVSVELRRIDLWPAVLLDSSEKFMISPDPAKDEVRQVVAKTAGEYRKIADLTTYRPVEAERLSCGDHVEIQLDHVDRYQEVFLTFVDAKGRGWEIGNLAGNRPALRKAKKKTDKRGRISAALYRLRHPWTAQKEFRTRLRARCRAFIEGLKIAFVEAIVKALDNEEVRSAFRKSIDSDKIKTAFSDALKKALAAEMERRKLAQLGRPDDSDDSDDGQRPNEPQ
ncbi:hypothetical protein A5638_09360 [Mycolicibacterium fortuitum]|nr:hypothetical protein A5638_09360 [Mycolicibacterium fortuitum]